MPTDEQMSKAISEETFAMQIRVLATPEQLDALNTALAEAAKQGVFVVHHITQDPNDFDIEEALENSTEIDWSKLGVENE